MPRRGALSILITVGALALLLSFKTPDTVALPIAGQQGVGGNAQSSGAITGNTTGSTTGTATGNITGSTTGTTGNTTTGAGTGTASGTFTGQSVQTPFGPLQVAVVMQSGKIANVNVLSYPSSHGRSVAINQYALPILTQEVLQAQSANVNGVSGATYTSQAYMQSLQSALDQAK